MKKLLLFVFLLALIGATAYSQVVTSDVLYRVPMATAVSDTVPGTQAGGGGNGSCGWLYIGSNGVEMSITAQDSVNLTFAIDYADTGFYASTGSSAKSVGFATYTRVINQDTLANCANLANPQKMTSKILRDRLAGTDIIDGGRWLRLRLTGTADDTTFAASAAGKIVSLRLRQFKYSGQ